jgi:glycosyltransferase involved in cell wall biosynthesis
MKISLIQPSRNNLKYLKWSYDSIRKNQGDHEVEICVADDFSSDGTKEWCESISKVDKHFKWIRNEGPDRKGLVILNDKLINEIATHDICMIYHADMYLCPGALDSVETHLKEKTIVSLTRIEPSLHPPGPEKVLLDCGIEPEEFDEEMLLTQLDRLKTKDKTTEGIFAPWVFWKKDFQEIGGHDILFAPQSKEDSDIFNRFHLNGIKFVQTWEGFVYHMTSRGSRFNPYSGGAPGKNSEEWIYTTTKNERNFIRKWGTSIQHDSLMKPIVSPKYKIAFKIKNCTEDILRFLEPWGDHAFVDCNFTNYLLIERNHTTYDLIKRVLDYNETCYDDIIIEINAKQFTRQDYETISKLSDIIHDSGEIGEFQLGNLKITINSLQTYEKDLICAY